MPEADKPQFLIIEDRKRLDLARKFNLFDSYPPFLQAVNVALADHKQAMERVADLNPISRHGLNAILGAIAINYPQADSLKLSKAMRTKRGPIEGLIDVTIQTEGLDPKFSHPEEYVEAVAKMGQVLEPAPFWNGYIFLVSRTGLIDPQGNYDPKVTPPRQGEKAPLTYANYVGGMLPNKVHYSLDIVEADLEKLLEAPEKYPYFYPNPTRSSKKKSDAIYRWVTPSSYQVRRVATGF